MVIFIRNVFTRDGISLKFFNCYCIRPTGKYETAASSVNKYREELFRMSPKSMKTL